MCDARLGPVAAPAPGGSQPPPRPCCHGPGGQRPAALAGQADARPGGGPSRCPAQDDGGGPGRSSASLLPPRRVLQTLPGEDVEPRLPAGCRAGGLAGRGARRRGP
eukprot:15503796-Heterocapsa_arctica.AAC.1